MAWTQADLDNINKAIATGAKRVRFGTGENAHETEFESLDDKLKIKSMIEAELGITSSAGSSQSTGVYVSGLDHPCYHDEWRR